MSWPPLCLDVPLHQKSSSYRKNILYLLVSKKPFPPLHSCPGIYGVMPASTAHSSCLGQFDAGHPRYWHTTAQCPAPAGTIIRHWPRQNCYWGLQLCAPRHTKECLGPFPGMGKTWPPLWGLCSGQGTAPLDKAAVKEDLQENVKIFTETTLSKQCKEKRISRACPQKSSGWRLPRGGDVTSAKGR